MVDQSNKFLNYSGIVYLFKKIITWVITNFKTRLEPVTDSSTDNSLFVAKVIQNEEGAISVTKRVVNAGTINLSSSIGNNEYTTSNSIQDVLSSFNSKIVNILSTGLTRTIVTSLPTNNISATTIYMILASNDILNLGNPNSNQNVYNEYMYINNNWERIGSTEVNLDIDTLTTNDIDSCWDTVI